jgi:hypothetical protein
MGKGHFPAAAAWKSFDSVLPKQVPIAGAWGDNDGCLQTFKRRHAPYNPFSLAQPGGARFSLALRSGKNIASSEKVARCIRPEEATYVFYLQ